MPKYGSGLYGRKSSGKWGRLNGKEILDALMSGEISEETAKERMGKAQRDSLNKEYKKLAKETNKRLSTLFNFLQENEGMESEALRHTGGLMDIPEKAPEDLDELVLYSDMASNFLADSQSTPEGVQDFYREFQRDMDGYIDNDFYEDDNSAEYHEMQEAEWDYENDYYSEKWKYVNRILEACPEIQTETGGVSNVEEVVESAIINGRNMEQFVIDYIQHYNDTHRKGSDWHKSNSYSF